MKELFKNNKVYKFYSKFRSSLYFRSRRKYLKKLFCSSNPLNIVLGSGNTNYEGWYSTDFPVLDITSAKCWESLFYPDSIDRILIEHVLEHLTYTECSKAIKHCYKYLKYGGLIRVAVPDGYNPNPDYIKHVKPRGTGAGAEDHKILYNYHLLSDLLSQIGFKVDMLEYWDEKGQFHYKEWNIIDGFIKRSKDHDERNSEGSLNYSSLIVDAVKP